MRLATFGLLSITLVIITACSPAAGSAEWCQGVVDGSITPTQQEMIGNIDKCAEHELAG